MIKRNAAIIYRAVAAAMVVFALAVLESSVTFSSEKKPGTTPCGECHAILFKIRDIKTLQSQKMIGDNIPCAADIQAIGENAISIDEAMSHIENMEKKINEEIKEKSASAERDAMIIMRGEIDRVKEDRDAHDLYAPPDAKAAAAEYASLKKGTDALYHNLFMIHTQRRFKNMLLISTAACVIFLFAVMVGFKKLIPR